MTRRITASDGIDLALSEHGEPNGPVIVAVHGYPDNRTLWDGVHAELAGRFRVVTYDVRGAGESGMPAGRSAYRLDQLADDLAVVLREVSPDRPVHLLAHDWGSIQCWHALTDARWSGLVASYTSISGPCLDHVGQWVRDRLRHPRPRPLCELGAQLALSAYIAFFQLPRVPELAWNRGVLSWLVGAVQRLDPASDRHRPELADGLHGLKLYRANMLPGSRRTAVRALDMPVQVLVPERDLFVSAALQTEVGGWARDPRVRRVPGGHWMPRARPSVVAEHVAALVDEVECDLGRGTRDGHH